MGIAYIVHDLADAAVARRVAMFRAGGAEVRVAGFRRTAQAPAAVGGAPAIDLGQTHDARLMHRAGAVLSHAFAPSTLRGATAGADVIVARNLEQLVLAARVRGRGQRLVYECLDIHRAVLGVGLKSRALRAVEVALLQRADLLIYSSPAFLRDYFSAQLPPVVSSLLVENKLLALGEVPSVPSMPLPGSPWTIGWFGNLRCRQTLDDLTGLAAGSRGRVAVLVAGRPSQAELPDLETRLAAAPGCRFAGPYTPDDLTGLYGQCHFAWAIDHFEEGLNSNWLLPNRLYEAMAFGVVPIALAGVETGRMLASLDAGLLLANDEALTGELDVMTGERYAALRGAVLAVPRDRLIANRANCEALVAAVAGR